MFVGECLGYFCVVLGAFSCFPCIVPHFCYFSAIVYSVVAGDWKMVAIVGKNGSFFRCYVGFFISFYSLMSWNTDDCGVFVRLVVVSSWMVDISWFGLGLGFLDHMISLGIL